jgi:hypothetical protein
MSHPSIERLAALADEPPTADEKDHLDRCANCAQEVDAHRSLLAMAGSERGSMGIPLTRWDTLSQALRSDGLISTEPASVTAEWQAPVGRKLSTKAWLRFAAAIMLIVSGTIIGRASAGASILPGLVDGQTPATTAGVFPLDSNPTRFASVQEAQQWKSFYADAYQNAVSYLAAHDSASRSAATPAVMRARLSALDRVSRTMREALYDAPYDPVINDFYLNSFGQREATLRQLNAVLPQGVRMNGF